MASELKRDPVRSIRFDRAMRGDAAEHTTTKQWYGDPSGSFKTGFWAGQPGQAENTQTIAEFCVLLEGLVRLTYPSRPVGIYRSHDTFLIPHGLSGPLNTAEPAPKIHALI